MNSLREIMKSDEMRFRTPAQEETHQQERSTRMERPKWVDDALWVIDSKFSTRRGMEEIDEADAMAYGRIFVSLGQEKTGQVLAALRERFTWRPSVAEVKAAADELSGRELIFDRDAKAQRVVKCPLALPPHPDNPARLAFERKKLELHSRRKAEGDWPTRRVVQGGAESEAA